MIETKAIELQLANPDAVDEAVAVLHEVDKSGMLRSALKIPNQIVAAIDRASEYNEGDLPLDRSCVHLVGLGGSAIAGDLLSDMLFPKRFINIHRGTMPQRDRAGVVLSSYSGNTNEIIELSWAVTGGLRTVVVLTSGGRLEGLAREWGLPIWYVPTGYQPRAAVGWSMTLLACIMERWRVVHGLCDRLHLAARKLELSLKHGRWEEHPLVRAALPIADALDGRHGIILHSLSTSGAAQRMAAQINENAKQTAFAVTAPEALHNCVEGIAAVDSQDWTLVFMSDEDDPPSLRASLNATMDYFNQLGFNCIPFPAAGDNRHERTLSRLLLSDLVSLFLAAVKGLDPTPLETITSLKENQSPISVGVTGSQAQLDEN